MKDSKPCIQTGHDYEFDRLSGFHTHDVPHCGRTTSFTIKRKEFFECRKCGDTKIEKQEIGEVGVDKETNELSIEWNDVDHPDREEWVDIETGETIETPPGFGADRNAPSDRPSADDESIPRSVADDTSDESGSEGSVDESRSLWDRLFG